MCAGGDKCTHQGVGKNSRFVDQTPPQILVRELQIGPEPLSHFPDMGGRGVAKQVGAPSEDSVKGPAAGQSAASC